MNSANAGVRLSNVLKDVQVNLRRSDIVRATEVKGNVTISGRGQDIELEKVAGAVTVDGEFSGTIKLADVAKPVRYSSSRTELGLEKLAGHLEMNNGSLTANDLVGPFKLTTRSRSNKDVRLEGFTKEVEITMDRGDIELRTGKLPLANIHVQSRHGDIHLELPGNAAFQFQATAAHGEAFSEFDNIKVEQRGKSAVEMRGGAAAAAAHIRLSTDRGSIRLRKAGSSQGPSSKATIETPPVAPSIAQPGNAKTIRGENSFGCVDREYFGKLTNYAVQKDEHAFSRALAAGLAAGTCTSFKNGDMVLIMDTAIFSGLVKVRRQGETREYWTNLEAVK